MPFKFFTFLCVLLSFISCEKEETPIPKINRGETKTVQIDMGSTYKNQVWYSLSTNSIVALNLKDNWDIAFECSQQGTHIILNYSKSMRCYVAKTNNLLEVKDTIGITKYEKIDAVSGNMDSTAIGNWTENNQIIVINRGYNEAGKHQGFSKIKFISVDDFGYNFEYAAELKSSDIKTAYVAKNKAYNFMAFSFTTHLPIIIEPQKTDYDICFTQYTHVFYNPLMYYLVAGVLLNHNNTYVAKINNKSFDEISLNDTASVVFKNNIDAIGYDWKSFNISTNIFTVDTTKKYLIRDSKGFYYKLHFLDFYNEQKIKGTPKFEYKKL